MKERNEQILIKVLTILLVVVAITSLSSIVFAKAQASDPSSWSGTTTGLTNVTNIGQKIIGVVQTVGSLAAVIVLVIIGIKYMMGSTEEKAEYKKTMIPYIIGAVLIFAASNVAGMIYNFANQV